MTESKPPRGESPPPAPQSWGESAPRPPILGERGERVVWGGHPPVPPAGERPCAPGEDAAPLTIPESRQVAGQGRDKRVIAPPRIGGPGGRTPPTIGGLGRPSSATALTHLYQIVQRRAAAYPDAIALGAQEGLRWRTITSRELLALADRLAAELASRGIGAGDRVVLWLPSHWRTPIYLFALWKLGAIVVPFDREMNPSAAARILTLVEPRCILVGYDERPSWAHDTAVTDWWGPGSATTPAPPSASPLSNREEGPPPADSPQNWGAGAAASSPGVQGRSPAGGQEGVALASCPGGQGRSPTGGVGVSPTPLSLSPQDRGLGGAVVCSPQDWGAGGAGLPAEEVAAIVFTSGTTGDPKGCTITHANLCSQVEAIRYTIPLDPSCRLASILPLSHLFELTVGLLYPLAQGAAVHYVPSRRGPDIVRVFAEQRITHLIGVPQLLTLMGQTLDAQLRASVPGPAYRALCAAAERLPLAARRRLFWLVHRKLGGELRTMAAGGAALPAETQQLWERLGVRVVQGYGTSECSPVVACGAADGSTPQGSVGKPLRGVEVRLSAEGELQVHGPNVMRGYWKDPVRTAEVLHDGWYATGDLATIDAQGNVWLAGRAKDLIVLPSGMNVWPQDVEDALRQDPAVKDATVLAVPTTSGGATLHAYLLPASPAARDADLGALVARANGRLAQHQRLATASWWAEADFPRTSTLKVRRNLLPLPENVGAVKVESVLAADDPVAQAIAGAARVQSVPDDQTLGGLGLDSLGLVDLALTLEQKSGKAVGDGDLRLEMTVAQVRELLTQAPALDGAGGGPADGRLASSAPAHWPYTPVGRAFRGLGLPFDLLYRYAVTRTYVIGREHLQHLPPRVIFAGTHRSFADMPLVRRALAKTVGREQARRLVVAARADGFGPAGIFARYGILAFGLYPLNQQGQRDASLRGLARLAEEGNAILIFPQGTHSTPEQEHADDPAVRFRPGVAHLAEALDAAVVPFGLAGTEQLIPPDVSHFEGRVIAGIPVALRRGPLAIAFGAPLMLQPDESPHAFAARLQAVSYALTRQAEQAIAHDPHRHLRR
jgi:long-chain acyl-CoA synthetase